jgi:hypothetical protein
MAGRPVGDAGLREELLRRLDLDQQARRAGAELAARGAVTDDGATGTLTTATGR